MISRKNLAVATSLILDDVAIRNFLSSAQARFSRLELVPGELKPRCFLAQVAFFQNAKRMS